MKAGTGTEDEDTRNYSESMKEISFSIKSKSRYAVPVSSRTKDANVPEMYTTVQNARYKCLQRVPKNENRKQQAQ